MSVHVQLEQFEGPLGLLLYLIRKEEMDIKNIPITKITSRYLEFIRTMRDFDLEVAGEFVAMAATLIHIKSRMLLPQYNEQGEVVEAEDPRKELVRRLLDYQKFQVAAKELGARPLLGRDVFARGTKEEYEEGVEEVVLEDGGLYAMISLYRIAMRKLNTRIHTVYAKGQSIASRIMEIKDRFVMGRRTELREILERDYTRTQLLITFLSVLELARLGFISIFQAEVYGDLYLDPQRPVERDVVGRVQEYETQDSDRVAESWVQLAQKDQALGSHDLASVPDDVPVSPATQIELFDEGVTDDELLAAETELGLVASPPDARLGESIAEVEFVNEPSFSEDNSGVVSPLVLEAFMGGQPIDLAPTPVDEPFLTADDMSEEV